MSLGRTLVAGVGETGARHRQVLAAAVPLVLAIGVFGTLYGAAARPLLGTATTILSSAVVFSGSVQFMMVGLLASGVPVAGILFSALLLNLRNILLGAVLRPHLRGGVARRLLLGWFVIDETVGLTLASGRDARRTLVVVGGLAYLAWVTGTALGAWGAGLTELRSVAEAAFPVMFIGLAAMGVRDRSQGARAVAAAVLTAILGAAWPDARGILPAVVAAAVAAVGDPS